MTTGRSARSGVVNGPVIMLAYAHSGADRVQDALAAGTKLACTAGTGIIPLCAAAAETWRRIEGQHDKVVSRLATVSIQQLVTAQVTAILASAGGTRWCELANVPPSAAEAFLHVFPDASFVCVHRSCPDVIRAGLQANPWGLQGQGLMPYLLAYPGNSVAALAAYWASSAEQLLAFEDANREKAHRIRYEDVTAHPDQALATVRTALQLDSTRHQSTTPGQRGFVWPDTAPSESRAEIPAELVPGPLRERITHLHTKLGYPPYEAWVSPRNVDTSR